MNKNELTNKIQEGFLNLAPDMFDEILEVIEQSDDDSTYTLDKKNRLFFHDMIGYGVLKRVAVWFLVVGIGFGFFNLQCNRTQYVVTLDVNPSIRMELNKEYSVRSLEGLNEDGKQFIKELEWEKNISVEQMLDILTNNLVLDGYLKEDGGILVTVYHHNKVTDSQELKDRINLELERDTNRYGVNDVVVAFQTAQGKEKQTGREILKQKILENSNLNDKDVEEMNIRVMIECFGKANEIDMIEGNSSDPSKKKDNENADNKINNKDDKTDEIENKENKKEPVEKDDINKKQNKTDKANDSTLDNNRKVVKDESNKPEKKDNEPVNDGENERERPIEENNKNEEKPNTNIPDESNPDTHEQDTKNKNPNEQDPNYDSRRNESKEDFQNGKQHMPNDRQKNN